MEPTANTETQFDQQEYERLKEELVERTFFRKMRIGLTERMLWKEGQDLGAWCDNVLENLVPFVKGLQASIYYLDKKSDTLKLAGSFAVPQNGLIQKEIGLGENAVGEVARSMQPLYTEIFADPVFLPYTLNMAIKPKAVFAAPLIYNQKTAGVMEILFYKTVPQSYLDFITEICGTLGASISSMIYEKQLVDSFDKIQESEERFKRLAEVTSEGIAFLDGVTVSEVNSVFLRMFGYADGSEVVGKHISGFVATEINSDSQELAHLLLTRKRSYEAKGIKSSSELFDLEIEAREMFYGGQQVRVATFRDITEKKRTEIALKESKAKLEEAQKIVELHDVLERKNRNITGSINYAKRIQDAILPDIKQIKKRMPDSFVLHMAKDVVSGDFYWYQEKGDKIFIAAVDCTGHGVPGAFMSLLGSTMLNQIVTEKNVANPRFILDLLDADIQQALKQEETQNKDGMDLALCVIDKKTHTLEYSGARRPLVYIQDNEVFMEKAIAQSIGGATTSKQAGLFKKATVKLDKPTCFYIFSDGYQDQFSPDGQKYMIKRLKDFLLEIHHRPMPEQKQLLEKSMLEWLGGKNLIDDILVIGFRLDANSF